MAAPSIEIIQEVSLGLDALIIFPGVSPLIPGSAVDRDTVDQCVWSIFTDKLKCLTILRRDIIINENHDISIAMSSSLADPVLGLNILQG